MKYGIIDPAALMLAQNPEWLRIRNETRRKLGELCLRDELHEYGIQVVGSWASLEPHVLIDANSGEIVSFSDIDLVFDKPMGAVRNAAIKNIFIKATSGLKIKKVSMRRLSEYEKLPHGSHSAAQSGLKKNCESQFVYFWYVVACSEAIHTQHLHGSGLVVTHYSIAKVLFTLLRSWTQLRSREPSTYWGLVETVRPQLDYSVLEAAYSIKLGVWKKSMDRHSLIRLGMLVSSALQGPLGQLDAEHVVAMQDLLRCCVDGDLDSSFVAEHLYRAAYSDVTAGVVDYQLKKLEIL